MIGRRLLDNFRWNIRHELRTAWRRSKLKNKVWHSSHYITDISRFLKEHTNKLKYVTVLFTKQHVYCTLWLWLKEGLGCGIRTWDLVTWDSGTWDSGTWDSGTWDARTQGRGTRGRGTRGRGTRGRGTRGLGDARRLGDVINKQHLTFALNL